MLTLTYFDIRGRAEVIRLFLALANVTYTDRRITMDEWGPMKSTTPFGHLPFIDESGKVLAETVPIMAYLGQKYGFVGNNSWDQALATSVCSATNDVFNAISRAFMMPDGPEKEAEMEKFRNNLNTVGGFHERFITQNGRNGRMVGTRMTIADVCMYYILELLENAGELNMADVRTMFPRMAAVYQAVKSNPNIVRYLVNRPPSDM